MKTLTILFLLAMCSCSIEESDENQLKTAETEGIEEAASYTNIPDKWKLHELRWEKYYCFDDFFNYVDIDTQMFCGCLVEKISVRWGHEDFIRHKYGYYKRMSDNGTLDQCNEEPDFFKDEEEDEELLEEDRAFDPEAEEDEGDGEDDDDEGDMESLVNGKDKDNDEEE